MTGRSTAVPSLADIYSFQSFTLHCLPAVISFPRGLLAHFQTTSKIMYLGCSRAWLSCLVVRKLNWSIRLKSLKSEVHIQMLIVVSYKSKYLQLLPNKTIIVTMFTLPNLNWFRVKVPPNSPFLFMRKKCIAIGQERIVITEVATTWRKGAVTCQDKNRRQKTWQNFQQSLKRFTQT